MANGPPPSYEMVCKLVGQLYLESRFALEQSSDLHRQEMDKLRQERDDALKLIVSRENGPR
jgi:hypothetical protein